ncbi:MAG TPA: aminomethyltransferase family protein [Candidatus Methylomirabilis sp.]|nr:aminomethyltransferase family protein [Candidatus Methylomirabilis sp.]
MALQSPFRDQEKALGATFVEHSGMEVPEDFGDPGKEYGAVRTGVGLLDFSFRGMIRLTGSERLRWLNGQISNEVKDLASGEGKQAAVLSPKGHILGDLVVYGLTDAVWVDVDRMRAPVVRDAFERHIIADDVTVEDVSDRHAHLVLAGPEAPRFMAEAAGVGIADLTAWHHVEVRLGSVSARIVASRWLAMPGFDVVIPADEAGKTWDALLSLGPGRGVTPVGMAALRCLRVEAGWPWYGVDLDDTNLLMESLTADHVSFTKGCYVGQEVVIRVEHQGHVNKRLCGLLLSCQAPPPAGAAILSGERKIGTVTSAVRSPALGKAIALGYVRRDFWEPGTKLQILAGEHGQEAEVVSLPFVSSAAGKAGGPEG